MERDVFEGKVRRYESMVGNVSMRYLRFLKSKAGTQEQVVGRLLSWLAKVYAENVWRPTGGRKD
jgi:hypothetical protein